jgi:hypothetical protein
MRRPQFDPGPEPDRTRRVGSVRQHLRVTCQPVATDNPSSLSSFVRKHFALFLGGIPLALAGIRLVVVSQGDSAVMAALIQTLNLSTVVMYTVTTAGPFIVFFLLLALATGGGEWVPRQDRSRRSWWVVLYISFAVNYLLSVSWRMALLLIGTGAGVVILGLVLRRKNPDEPIVSMIPLVIGLLVSTLLQVGLWLPLERITLKDGSARVGYVLNVADPNPSDPVTILWREGGLVYVKSGDLKDRQPCSDAWAVGPGLLDLVRDSTPSCPLAKVTPPGK